MGRLLTYLVGVDLLGSLVTASMVRASALTLSMWAVLTMTGFLGLGLYRQRLRLSITDDLARIAIAVVGAGLALSALAASPLPGGFTGVGPLAIAIALLVALTVRASAYRLILRARRAGRMQHPVLIVGAGQIGVRIAENLLADPGYGLYPVGFLEGGADEERLDDLPIPVLGAPEDLRSRVRALAVTRVIVAFGYQPESELVDVLRACDRLRCEILFVPRLFELHSVSRKVGDVRGIPLVPIRRAAFRAPSWRLKRLVDVVLSALALLALSPVLLVAAVAVRAGIGPGVLFRQQRVGLDGRPFLLLKFRTLVPRDDAESETRWNIQHDERLTRVGRFLRASSLDELPQLWNVFVGEMSLVGPRPERPHFVNEFSSRIPRYDGRHRVPAGLTGWSQVHGLRGDTSIEERARFDNYYIENWSLWLDLKIMLRTLGEVFARSGG